MATNPTPTTCLKCNTPLIAGAGFCGTCGTPAGAAGTPPLPPPMPPRPLAHGARQVVVQMDQASALNAAAAMLPSLKGQVTNQSPMQIAFMIGNYFSGRYSGTIDAHQDAPGRTALNATLKPDYGSLIPALIAFVIVTVISTILIGKADTDRMYQGMMYGQMQAPGISAYLSWWMIGLFILLIAALCFWLMGGPILEKRRQNLLMSLQSIGGAPARPGMPGMGMPGMPHHGAAPPPFPGGAPNFEKAAPAAPAAPAQATPIEQLKKLAELRDAGAISQDDFDQAKAAILARMS